MYIFFGQNPVYFLRWSLDKPSFETSANIYPFLVTNADIEVKQVSLIFIADHRLIPRISMDTSKNLTRFQPMYD
jgi:hypothetical protein